MEKPIEVDMKTENQILTEVISLEQIQNLSEAFKVLGDPTKLRICMLLAERELPVSSIAEKLNLSDSAVSHSLRTLRNLRLVKYYRDGKNIFYSLDDKHVEDLIRLGCDHIMEDEK